ncbi:MAG TPA: hypothetical protein VFM18_15910 [Methanosarcina sp.]|nr:hypothetical protein [Methanosarcina sp.]
MADTETLVSGIEFKVLKLIGQVKDLKAENEHLLKEISNLKNQIEQQEKTIRSSESKMKILTTARTLETKEGTVEAKAKITGLLREIDKCIGLLNT